MRATYITATVIALAILAWLFSGQIGNESTIDGSNLAERNRQADALQQDRSPTRIRARVIQASPQTQYVVLRGKTENKRTVSVKAETAGRIVERPVERGERVEAGELLCQISLEDRYARLTEMREAFNQAQIEYQGSLKLKERGFQSDTAIAQAKARLAAAEAQVHRAEIEIQRTYVRAPFAGVVEDVHQEVGDYVTPGAACVTVVDLNPMLLVGRVAEKDVQLLELDQHVTGILSDGTEVTGPVSFIGQQSDPATRTYAVEIQVPNADYALRSGLTTEIRVPVAQVMAQKISPALFALNDLGQIGVRTVDESGKVRFHPVQIVRDTPDGVWVSGLPEVATLITVGQELVVPGEQVEVDYESATELPAATPRNTEPETGKDGLTALSDNRPNSINRS
ncbi:MAG: efflux RND transporter periplasmic adaptor subunit [Pseudomonadales bacterium]|nr:efflux RND transporter periplasmic adaptor subunit [Pseudomonadales bacterium]